tara:strand:+ start:535 stop:882 length:348 start_codon:yes stop_codon:yes gene_type:complete
MAHKGIREFEPQELSSIALGQNGFHVLGAGGSITTVTAASKGIKYWVAIKAVDNASVVEARTLQGEDFSKDAVGYDAGPDVATDGLSISNGDIIYGCFDAIEIASGDFVIAYIGK